MTPTDEERAIAWKVVQDLMKRVKHWTNDDAQNGLALALHTYGNKRYEEGLDKYKTEIQELTCKNIALSNSCFDLDKLKHINQERIRVLENSKFLCLVCNEVYTSHYKRLAGCPVCHARDKSKVLVEALQNIIEVATGNSNPRDIEGLAKDALAQYKEKS